MRKHLPIGCVIIRALDLQALETITKEVLAQSMPVVVMIAEDPVDIHDQITNEVYKLWKNIDPSQIAYILKQLSNNEWNDPDVLESFYGLSVEEIILDYVDCFLIANIEDIMQDCMGPGEEYIYDIYINTFDNEVVEKRLQDLNVDYDPEKDDKGEEDKEGFKKNQMTRILGDKRWREKDLVKGYVMEVTGENAAIYIDDNGKEYLYIPNLLQLLYKVKKANAGNWYEHKPGWRFRLVPVQVADPV
jgi:hypothetical protein